MPHVRYIVIAHVNVHVLADPEAAVGGAARKHEELQSTARLAGIWNELGRWFRIRRRRESTDRGEGIEIGEPEIQRLPAAHRETRERAKFAIGVRTVASVDRGNDVVEQIALERREGRCGRKDIAFCRSEE